jgi:hypothetical protein
VKAWKRQKIRLKESEMSLETILILVLLMLFLGGGGYYWQGRG